MTKYKYLIYSVLISLTMLPLAAQAKKPHPAQHEPAPVVDSCECSAFTLVPDSEPVLLETLCSVQWTTPGAAWPTYGASLEYEAEWMVDETELSIESETEVDSYICVFGTDDVCNADGVVLSTLDHPVDATVEFQLRVKGFDNKSKGGGSRDFVKVRGDCTVAES